MRRYIITISLLAALLLGLGLFWQKKPPLTAAGTVRMTGQAAIGGAFEAVDHMGKPFTQANLLGHFSLVYFGFTYCPDICPTTLLTIAETLDSLPEDLRKQLMPVFVTVDPLRDTVEVLRQYVSNFHPQLIGITGSEAQISQLARAYKVYHAKAPASDDSGNYLVDHSGYVYLMSPKGEYVAHFPHNVTTQHLADALRLHMVATK